MRTVRADGDDDVRVETMNCRISIVVVVAAKG